MSFIDHPALKHKDQMHSVLYHTINIRSLKKKSRLEYIKTDHE